MTEEPALIDALEEPPAAPERVSEIRELARGVLGRAPDSTRKVSEAIDRILLDAVDLFAVLKTYMEGRDQLLRDLLTEATQLKRQKAVYDAAVERATFRLLKFTYVTVAGRSVAARLVATNARLKELELAISFLKLPLGAHPDYIDQLKQCRCFDHLGGLLDMIKTIMTRINQEIIVAQKLYDEGMGRFSAGMAQRKACEPMKGFRDLRRRIDHFGQLWFAAYHQPAMVMHLPQCRDEIPEDMPLWEMYQGWHEPWTDQN